MKKTLLLFAIVIPLLASAMKIEKDEIDEFTGTRTLITSWESICKREIHIRFRLQNGFKYLDFKMFYDGAIVIGKDDRLMFKSTTDKMETFKSISIYHGAKGDGAVGISGSGAWGIYASYEGNLSYFEDNIPRLMRAYTSNGYIDKTVSDSDGKN